MSTDKNKPTKQELLSELESIRASLFDGDNSSSQPNTQTDISSLLSTVLDDVEEIEFDTMIKDHENIVKNADINKTSNTAAKSALSTPLPGQQSLFSELADTPNHSPSKTSTEENPFLPHHIRERLSQSRNSTAEDLTEVGKTLNKNPKPFANVHESDPIIDSLIAKYLPIIEKELREKLTLQLASKEQK